MGDFSRDTFRLTNVMHQVAAAVPVPGARHYVGVRLQQAVPLLDADWNELEDIRRLELELQTRYYLGDGIPTGSTGFAVGAVTDDNDFAIATGMALVEGRLVFNEFADLSYRGQTALFGVTLPDLAPPPAPSRQDLVYLDVWEEETAAAGLGSADERLTHPAIGVETCRRIERRWLVRVQPDAAELSAIVREPGHAYMALARLHRVNGQQSIAASRIFDLRRTDLNVARYLKIPVFVERAGALVDSDRIAELLDGLRGIYTLRLANNRFFVDAGDPLAQTLLHFGLQHVMQTCTTGALQARTRNLTNADALALLSSLGAAQRECIAAIDDHGLSGIAKDTFVAEYGTRLDAVESALAHDLLEGYQQQQSVNVWLAGDVDALPEGNVTLQFLAVSPDEPLQATATYEIFVRIESGVTSNRPSEVFDVIASLSSAPWNVAPAAAEVTIANGGSANLSFDVTVPAEGVVGGTTADFSVVARARRNPAIASTQLPLVLEVGQRPLAGGVLQYSGPPLNAENRMELANAVLTAGGVTIAFLLNNTDAAPHTYGIDWFVALDGGADTTGWAPLTALPGSASIGVAAEDQEAALISFNGPNAADVTGVTGSLHVRLVEIDAAPAGTAAEEVVVDFIVV